MKGLQAILHQVEAKYLKNETHDFRAGDSVKVHLKVREGEKERVQIFEGTVIGRGKEGTRQFFRVRRIASGVGVERAFLFNSPNIVKIQVTRRGTATRSRLYYLKGKSGKEARITEARHEDVKPKETVAAVTDAPPVQAHAQAPAPVPAPK
jgi:large subunit ribosomal protein L19